MPCACHEGERDSTPQGHNCVRAPCVFEETCSPSFDACCLWKQLYLRLACCRSSAAEIDSQHVLWLRKKCYKTCDSGDPPHRDVSLMSGSARADSEDTVAGPYSQASPEIAKALKNSSSVIAAYCRADALPEGIIQNFPGRIRIQVDDDSGSNELWQRRRAAKRQKVLIGVAHASSDQVFVATVDHVMVLPELQNQGLGRRCGCIDCTVWCVSITPRYSS